MGALVEGRWTEEDHLQDATGRFVRVVSSFRAAIGDALFPPQAGRYHLYVVKNCPWAHRTWIFRALKGLQTAIPLHFAAGGPEGWIIDPAGAHLVPGTERRIRHLHELYSLADPGFSGRVTVPVLWDSERKTIVNNESSEIIRMFNGGFGDLATRPGDFYPEALRPEIESVNQRVYEDINNGVYRAGFATTQAAYDEAVDRVFAALDWAEERLSRQRYLCGSRLTEADWRLFPTLLRFDLVYYSHFKCNLRRLADYPNLSNYLRELHQWPGVAETCDLAVIKQGYYTNPTMLKLNPTGIVPKGPLLDYTGAHDRARFPAVAV